MPELTSTRLVLLAGAGSLGLLLGAFFFQAIGFAPCAMCIWQRWPHAVAIILALLWMAFNKQSFSSLILPFAAVLMWASAGLGIYHTGVERKWWLGPSTCTSSGSDLGTLSGDALLPSASMDAAIVLCDEVSWSFLGLSMASYNVLASIAFAVLWMMAWSRVRHDANAQADT